MQLNLQQRRLQRRQRLRRGEKAAAAKAPAKSKSKSKPATKKQAAKSKPAAKKQAAKSTGKAKKVAKDQEQPRIAKDDSAVPKASSSGGASIGRRNLHLEFDEAHSDSNASGSSDEDYIDSDGSASANSIEDAQGNVEDNDQIGEPTEDDPNLLADTDDLNTFAAFESDAENDDGDDDDASVDGIGAADVQLPAPPEMRFSPDARAVMDSTASARTAWLNEMGINGWSDLQTHAPYDYLMVPYEPRPARAMATDYPNLYAGESGPTPRALEAAATPSGAFFYFMQPELWEDIAEQPNDYFETNLDERVQGQHARQVARQKKHPEFKPKTPELIRNELIKSKGVTARESCIFVGLLIARSIVPNKEKLAHHWKTTDEGALPRGCFGQFMARDRFMHISRNLHFSRNDDERAAKDRAWKLRPVIDSLQGRFAAGFTPPAVMAFDEAILPSRSTFNKMRVGGTTASTDCNSGPAAVVLNLQHVFGPTAPPNGQMRLVVIDRFYSSVPLSMQLLTMRFYSIGTVRTDRQGLSTKLIPKKKKGEKKKPPKIPKNRPANIERGTFIVTDALEIPGMRLLRWWDTRAVHMLTTGGSVEMDRIATTN
ncbi:unnamed protein product [Phytophthora fragariaefolia]|uniref:Unnamed protein product n=1 Tax=Phytophthora fragariaefolia TaxID=1490495 RepID=A0A9W6XRN2_9STRA|nr:unnamed protein product [Phytophthora fragariaefolia]